MCARQYLKGVKPSLRTVAVEPAESPVLSGGKPGPHKIQGIGAGFVPGNCDQSECPDLIFLLLLCSWSMLVRWSSSQVCWMRSFKLHRPTPSLSPDNSRSRRSGRTLSSLRKCDDVSYKEFVLGQGVFCGISSGAAVKAAVELSKRPENSGKVRLTDHHPMIFVS